MVTTRYSDQQGSKSRQKLCDSTSNGTDQYQNGSSNLLYSISRAASIDSDCCRLPTTSVLSNKSDKYVPTSFDQQFQVSQGHTSYKNKENRNTEVHGGGGLELVKPAHEPASSRPKPCASLKKPHESCPFAAPCGPRRKKNDAVRDQLFLRNLPVRAIDSRAQGFSPPLARQRSSCPPPSPNLLRTYPIENYQVPGSPRQCSLPLACRHPPEGHQIGARKRRTPENTILSQPHCRRVSTDRPNRESSQLAASLEGEPGPTPAGKTLPHSYPETRFRRERARVHAI